MSIDHSFYEFNTISEEKKTSVEKTSTRSFLLNFSQFMMFLRSENLWFAVVNRAKGRLYWPATFS